MISTTSNHWNTFLLRRTLVDYPLYLSRRNIEPFGDRRVDLSWWLPRVRWEIHVNRIILANSSWRVLNANVCDREIIRRGPSRALALDEASPRFMAFMYNLGSVFLVFGLTRKGEGILRLSIGDFVNPEPLIGGAYQTRQVTFDILNVIEFGRKRIIDVHDDDFPIGLALVEQSHDTENFDLLDLASITYLFSDLADIERIIIAPGLGFGMLLGWIFPGLRESPIIPNVPMMRETVPDEAKSAFLNILLDRIEGFLLRDLHLSVRPARDLYDHVEDTIALIYEEWDVMEGRDDVAIVLEVHAMWEGVRGVDESGTVRRGCHG